MTPTPRLRFVERQHGYKSMSSGEFIGNTVHVLQQWFTYDIDYPTEKGEWRDVSLEKENV